MSHRERKVIATFLFEGPSTEIKTHYNLDGLKLKVRDSRGAFDRFSRINLNFTSLYNIAPGIRATDDPENIGYYTSDGSSAIFIIELCKRCKRSRISGTGGKAFADCKYRREISRKYRENIHIIEQIITVPSRAPLSILVNLTWRL